MTAIQSKESIYEATSRIVSQTLKEELSKEKLDDHLNRITSRSDVLNKRDTIEALVETIQVKVREQLDELKFKQQIKPESVPIQHPEALATSKVYFAVQNALANWEYVKSNTTPQAPLNLYQRFIQVLSDLSFAQKSHQI